MDHFRILIVDDHYEVRRMLFAWVQSLGAQFEVMAIPSGEEAILEAYRRPVDLLITDYRLPGINGLELMAKIKQRYPDLKVILITGIPDTKVRHKVAEAGADAYFLKPIEMPDFQRTVEHLIGTVEALLPTGPILTEIRQASRTPSECLADLRRTTSAIAVALLDDHGEIQASAGHMPEENDENNIIPALMAAHYAGLKVSYAQGNKVPLNLMFFKGHRYHLCIAPVGSSHALLIAFDASRQPEFPPILSQPIFQAAQEILESLSRVSANSTAPSKDTSLASADIGSPPDQVETVLMPQEEELKPGAANGPDLSDIFKKVKAPLNATDLDRFWDTAVEQNNAPGAGDASALSYEEARRLGLAPKDEAAG